MCQGNDLMRACARSDPRGDRTRPLAALPSTELVHWRGCVRRCCVPHRQLRQGRRTRCWAGRMPCQPFSRPGQPRWLANRPRQSGARRRRGVQRRCAPADRGLPWHPCGKTPWRGRPHRRPPRLLPSHILTNLPLRARLRPGLSRSADAGGPRPAVVARGGDSAGAGRVRRAWRAHRSPGPGRRAVTDDPASGPAGR